jgi:hypothetical protein
VTTGKVVTISSITAVALARMQGFSRSPKDSSPLLLCQMRQCVDGHGCLPVFEPSTPGAAGMMRFMKSANKGTVKAVSP